MKRFVAIAVVGLLAFAGCSDGSDGDAAVGGPIPLAIDELRPALDAVRSLHPGEELSFTEINVQRDLINLFLVQPGDTELAYVWRNGVLEPPEGAEPQLDGASSFSAELIDLNVPSMIVERLDKELPAALPTQLTFVDSVELGLSWAACLLGELGEPIAVGFNREGAIVGVVPGGCIVPQ